MVPVSVQTQLKTAGLQIRESGNILSHWWKLSKKKKKEKKEAKNVSTIGPTTSTTNIKALHSQFIYLYILILFKK